MVCRVVRAKLFQYIDGELSQAGRTALECHVAACVECRRLLDLERTFRETYMAPLQVEAVPEEVRARVVQWLDVLPGQPLAHRERQLFRRPLAAGIAIIFLGSLSWFGLRQLWSRAMAPLVQLAEAAVEQHQKLARAVLPYDIAQVPPKVAEDWFRRRLDFGLSIPELPDEHITLQGGRISHLQNFEAAALHYQVEGKDVSLFVMPLEGYKQLGLADSPKFKIVSHKGYDVIVWTSRGLGYSLVSEIGGRSCLVCHSAEERLDPLTQAKGHQ
jgi:anti-sigma factor (TIGR02949 family)